ncbi:DUF1835 domain-containing protein [Ammoniphilus sp. YIM 78166]|uniref:DUF1835 domain-containing protein n=1 Tax=Ammoniphilus sp. YIM 78166 TaxID=1644106 RepID=UPI00106F672E|nr:DUF1835 domain-containing protein [Ammoniphilus sp. YIM 78166]
MVHVVNGDIVGKKLSNQLEGEIIVWREMYDYGPLPDMKKRASFFEENVGIPSQLFLESCARQRRMLYDLPRGAEITLWFEHDRYDQTMLMYLLQELSMKGFRDLSMVTLDAYPGIEPFFGLGQLSSEQLVELYSYRRQAITGEQVQEAITGWKAYTSPTPYDLETWIAGCEHPLPFLAQAMQNHLQYYPSTHTGLNEVEALSLSFIRVNKCSFDQLFTYICRKRPLDGLSDLHFAALLSQLLTGATPLLKSDGPLPSYQQPQANCQFELTSFGSDVLDGRRDRFYFIGIDWWLGGVHLREDRWRWDGERIVE